jgi:REP element-mobilizing transposase RayT
MPNHLHGIIIINTNVETRHASSLQNKKLTLSNIVGSFKSAVTKFAHEKGFINFSWQPRFYDRIIRNEKELFTVRKYIEQNPLKWELEKDNPENIFDL